MRRRDARGFVDGAWGTASMVREVDRAQGPGGGTGDSRGILCALRDSKGSAARPLAACMRARSSHRSRRLILSAQPLRGLDRQTLPCLRVADNALKPQAPSASRSVAESTCNVPHRAVQLPSPVKMVSSSPAA